MKRKLVIILAVCAVAAAGTLTLNEYRSRTRNMVELLVQRKKMIHVLVAGSNAYRDNRHRFFAIVSINPENGNGGITFIPPGFGIADSAGKMTMISDIDFSDFDVIRQALLRDLRLSVPFYVELYAPDVERLVDLAEGMDIYVLDQYPVADAGGSGLRYFDGSRTMRYINTAAENSIFLKYDRIQDILFTLFQDRAARGHLLGEPLVAEMFKTIKTNLLPREIFRLAQLLMGGKSFSTIILPGSVTNGYYVTDDIAFKLYEEDYLSPLVLGKPGERVAKIKILNGTSVPGLARKMRRKLVREGFTVVEFGTSPFGVAHESVIVYRRSLGPVAEEVARSAGIRSLHPVIDSTQLYSILMIIGDDLADEFEKKRDR